MPDVAVETHFPEARGGSYAKNAALADVRRLFVHFAVALCDKVPDAADRRIMLRQLHHAYSFAVDAVRGDDTA